MDLETFLIGLYVLVDTFCQMFLPVEAPSRGRRPSLSPSEVITLALLSQWARFRSERDFHRFARQCLATFFPHIPAQSQFNRLVRQHRDALQALFQWAAKQLVTPEDLYEVLDSTGVAVRDRRRRGDGWLFGLVNMGKSNRLGFYTGFHLLTCCNPVGVITGYAFSYASANDQRMADTFFALRCHPDRPIPTVGDARTDIYMADKGFSSDRKQQERKALYGAYVIAAPQAGHGTPWPKEWRLWLAKHRQIIETVHDKLLNTFRLDRERPHTLDGFHARLAAKMSLHNACIWLNRYFGRPNLAFADLFGWA